MRSAGLGEPDMLHRKCFSRRYPKGPKYLYGTKYGFCSSKFPYGLGKDSPYSYLGPLGVVMGWSLRILGSCIENNLTRVYDVHDLFSSLIYGPGV